MHRDREQDAAAATVARARFRAEGPDTLPADPRIARLMVQGELLVAKRGEVAFDRRQASLRDRPVGDLYVTSERLILVGSSAITIALEDIEDAALIGDCVLLMLTGGAAIAIEADRPRLLRVQIAAARAARKRERAAARST
jgi:hypothetical protein